MEPSNELFPVSILFVDDKETNFKALEKRLIRAFRDQRCQAVLDYAGDPEDAFERLSGSAQIHVLLADLLFRQPDIPDGPEEKRGLDIIKFARQQHANTVIVALTSGSPDYPELGWVEGKGMADLLLPRQSLLAGSVYGGTDQLAKDVHALLRERGALGDGPLLDVDDEPGVQAALYEIKESTFRLLLADLCTPLGSPARAAKLSYLSPGASGAHVLRASVTLDNNSERRLLVKAARDPEGLMREVDNYQQLAGLYHNFLLIRYLPLAESAKPINGWSAIASEFADEAETLREWLADESNAAEVPSVLGQLFLNRGLASQYERDGEVLSKVSPLQKLALPPFRRVRIMSGMKGLLPILGDSDGAGLAGYQEMFDTIEAFSYDGRVGMVSSIDTPAGLTLVQAHGDLHGGNVLVSKGDHPRPVIIDLANFGLCHWAYDVARLVADILLRSLDTGVESFLWRRLPRWRELAWQAGELAGAAADERPENASVLAALNWLATHRASVLHRLADQERWWEWHVCLAEQLLRGVSQLQLPPAKRVLGVVAAFDQLKTAEGKIPQRRKTF